jgi:hypothetical protein
MDMFSLLLELYLNFVMVYMGVVFQALLIHLICKLKGNKELFLVFLCTQSVLYKDSSVLFSLGTNSTFCVQQIHIETAISHQIQDAYMIGYSLQRPDTSRILRVYYTLETLLSHDCPVHVKKEINYLHRDIPRVCFLSRYRNTSKSKKGIGCVLFRNLFQM